jgi:hypothetical protein
LSRAIPGCLGCWISENDALDDRIHYAEQWESEAALDQHIRSDLYRRVLAAIDLSRQTPEVTIYQTIKTAGFELIQALRAPPERPGHAAQGGKMKVARLE